MSHIKRRGIEKAGVIRVEGASEHNLKGISLEIPKDSLVVITGLSGSGKSSLAFDTLYAEGQRRYVESLSAYARQFLEMMQKPRVNHIEGLCPAISIEQKTTSRNPRSTVGTVTEIYDYLRLLFARVGTPYSPATGLAIEAQTREQMIERLLGLERGLRYVLIAPIVKGKKGEYRKEIHDLQKRGYQRLKVDGVIYGIEEVPELDKHKKHTIGVIVDRLESDPDDANYCERLSGSLETALTLGQGIVVAEFPDNNHEEILFSSHFSCPVSGFSLGEIEPRLFSFNSPFGACPACGGLGFEGGCFHSALADQSYWSHSAHGKNHRSSFRERSGSMPERCEKRENDDDENMYDSWQVCSECKGMRLRPEALCVKIGGIHIGDVTAMSIAQAHQWCKSIPETLKSGKRKIAMLIFKEIEERLQFLSRVGLDYLTLARSATTLSGGESQRIRLASQIGSGLTGVLYVLDEPSIGLHPRDNDRLISTLKHLRDLGNSVIVVEHDEETIRHADHIIDMGPGAGRFGGEVVSQGDLKAILACPKSLTGAYLRGERSVPLPEKRRQGKGEGKVLRVVGARTHNLKNITVEFPLGTLIGVSGVSGGGKSSLIMETLCRGVFAAKNRHTMEPKGTYDRIEGVELIDKLVNISQSPIGRASHSNPATYSGVFTPIREWFASLPEAQARGYNPGRFSFNVPSGRCDACDGDGVIRVEMHFLPDSFIDCEACRGKRYNRQTLEITYKGMSISDILAMPIEEAYSFFQAIPPIANKLKTLVDVGLGYLQIGQRAPTLSGGEAQRVKLAKELSRRSTGNTLYVLDEPTTGLHFEDVRMLLSTLHQLVNLGNTVIVIEHNLEVLKTVDWIIDVGPEGGDNGGYVVACGTPETIAQCPQSYTGRYVLPHL